ncbi:MAG: bifunctional histidinol-phosphatase/imidazoleglycerol-phosphate dehydratase HisB [Bacteroidia bacterium]|jgi:imidazoleglycerol-phosphate dehydratase/histidinol-phosphatase|nr:bifunctional histidinol-phosphatase/imidazoleglycerol-phosphate dehydratase HisB [Bacteroidia bacterium]
MSEQKKKILFIDRDGTLIKEPPVDFQIDSFEKLEFLPGVFTWLGRIARELDFELVMVTNQDGLGTASFPEHTFWPVHKLMMKSLAGEDIQFRSVHIDVSFPNEGKPTRKPGTAMLVDYLNGEFDLGNSFVIGDRITDVKLAKNLGAKAIFIRNYDSSEGYENEIALVATHWRDIYEYLRLPDRKVIHSRKTLETDIQIELNLDGTGMSAISTGVGFFDHMLDQLARHGQLDITLTAKGDLHIDEHHTIEDTAIALGEAVLKALGDKRGIERYAAERILPMDDCLAQVAIDFGGRPWLVWEAEFKREKVGNFPTEMFMHFFKSFSDAAKCNLNVKAEGENEHHKIEIIFKAFAKCIRDAVRRDPSNKRLPTTKGVL